jgi:hypothetical protein
MILSEEVFFKRLLCFSEEIVLKGNIPGLKDVTEEYLLFCAVDNKADRKKMVRKPQILFQKYISLS